MSQYVFRRLTGRTTKVLETEMYKVLKRTCFAIVLLTRSYVALRPRFRRLRAFFFIRDHKIRRRQRRGRELGGMGRGRRRKARKITLRTLLEDAVCSITGFWFISENMASFRDILKLLLESADDDDISKDEFLLLYDENISKKTQISLTIVMEHST